MSLKREVAKPALPGGRSPVTAKSSPQQAKTELSKGRVALGLGSRNPFVHLALSASRYPDKENTIFEDNKCEQSQCLKNLYRNATTDVIMERNM